MQILLVILLFVLCLVVGYLLMKITEFIRRPSIDPSSMQLLQQQFSQLQKDMGDRMNETHQAVRQNFAASTNVVRDVTEKLTKMEATARQVLGVTEQLQHLQDILKNPKQRGVVGEYYLETLLQNVMPPGSFQMQYAFRDGEIVDAAVFIKEKIVPIDSKFSLENYNRMVDEQNVTERDRLEKLFLNDVKLRVQETSKYIRPHEGTMEFAFMFIPHEAMYYDLLVNKIGGSGDDKESIIQRAAGKYRVIIVSPTSFLAYLQTVLQGLKALQIEEQAQEIRGRVADLGRHLVAYDTYFKNIGKHLGTTVNQYNLAGKELQKIDKDVLRISGSSGQIEPLAIDRPTSTEDL